MPTVTKKRKVSGADTIQYDSETKDSPSPSPSPSSSLTKQPASNPLPRIIKPVVHSINDSIMSIQGVSDIVEGDRNNIAFINMSIPTIEGSENEVSLTSLTHALCMKFKITGDKNKAFMHQNFCHLEIKGNSNDVIGFARVPNIVTIDGSNNTINFLDVSSLTLKIMKGSCDNKMTFNRNPNIKEDIPWIIDDYNTDNRLFDENKNMVSIIQRQKQQSSNLVDLHKNSSMYF